MTGCGNDPGTAARATPASPTQTATPTTSTATLPESYRYVLTSSCGERGLLGDYQVVVHHGRVTAVENLNENYPYDPKPSEIPTLSDLLDKAQLASPEAVIEFKLDESGLPKSLSLDPIPNGIDDEECYEVSDLAIASREPVSTASRGPHP